MDLESGIINAIDHVFPEVEKNLVFCRFFVVFCRFFVAFLSFFCRFFVGFFVCVPDRTSDLGLARSWKAPESKEIRRMVLAMPYLNFVISLLSLLRMSSASWLLSACSFVCSRQCSFCLFASSSFSRFICSNASFFSSHFDLCASRSRRHREIALSRSEFSRRKRVFAQF